jgi:hypothetical protein
MRRRKFSVPDLSNKRSNNYYCDVCRIGFSSQGAYTVHCASQSHNNAAIVLRTSYRQQDATEQQQPDTDSSVRDNLAIGDLSNVGLAAGVCRVSRPPAMEIIDQLVADPPVAGVQGVPHAVQGAS